METKIKIKGSSRWGYKIVVNDEVILECLTEEEVNNLTIGEIMNLWEEEGR